MGEYVFDQSWAQAYERAGGRYYPKIQVATPFTPVTGRRLLVAPDAPTGARDGVDCGLRRLRRPRRRRPSMSPIPRADADALARGRRLHPTRRRAVSFHQRGLSRFRRFSRRARLAQAQGARSANGARPSATICRSSASPAPTSTPAHWDAFFVFYMDTGARKWGRPYLTRAFFDLIGATMADRILLVMAKQGDELCRRRDQFSGRRRHLRPQLGRADRAALPAFRGLLLSGDRLRHRAWLQARRSRRAGRAQARARLSPLSHLVGA